METKGWLLSQLQTGDIHITPCDDLMIHTKERNCKCNPKLNEENNVIIVIHNSFDGREFQEGEDKRH